MQRWRSLCVLILSVTAVYLYAFPAANIPYAIGVLLHTGLGVLATVGIFFFLFRSLNQEPWLARFGWQGMRPPCATTPRAPSNWRGQSPSI